LFKKNDVNDVQPNNSDYAELLLITMETEIFIYKYLCFRMIGQMVLYCVL